MGYDFDRQKPIDNYIVDFFCRKLMLAIEVDGRSHDFKYEEDLSRQQAIEKFRIDYLFLVDVLLPTPP